ncbi:MAG: hypothetical protein A2Y15_09595 [Clostridiales bacterium GWF2_36_10]|nr:MAG: hypothetical protein A2Y15_09595 [Clostridiales bacterium GWF2_36_10]HAN21559.1 hypothetical protein [Clostridiales bacterium]
MASSRREEKYILDYRLYTLIRNRVSLVLQPDEHYAEGIYTVTSLYFDDPYKTAYYEKSDGLAVHTKFRVRSYDYQDSFLRLEKKTKQGLKTNKDSAVLSKTVLSKIADAPFVLEGFDNKVYPLAAEMQSKGLRPTVTVRYQREAFLMEGTDVRVTFDTRVEALPGDVDCLFDKNRIGIPAIHPANIIMEIKYNYKLPTLIRRLCSANAPQLSVSKYALCVGDIRLPAGFVQD